MSSCPELIYDEKCVKIDKTGDVFLYRLHDTEGQLLAQIAVPEGLVFYLLRENPTSIRYDSFYIRTLIKEGRLEKKPKWLVDIYESEGK